MGVSFTSADKTFSFKANSNELGELDGYPQGCPALLSDEVTCTHSFGTGVTDVEIKLQATDSAGRTATTEIDLAPYNACGRDIAYVIVRATEDGPAFDAPKLISPCQ